MRIVKLFFVFFFLSALSACVDTEEYIVINEDNSGVYTLQIDMGKIFGLANQMGAQEANTNKNPEKLDSTIYLKDLVFTAENLSAAEKELYKDATIKIKLDKPNAEMKIIMTCPFKSINQLPEIKNNFYLVMNKLKAFDKLPGREGEPADSHATEGMAEKALTPSATHYKFMAAPGKIEYSVIDTTGFQKVISSDSTMMMMQQMIAMMGEITYKTRITTAKEIKNFTGNKASLSADKKTIMFTSTFTEMLEQPQKLAYKIEY